MTSSQGEDKAVKAVSQLKPGRMVRCTVTGTEPGGYTVKLKETNAQGFIPGGTELEIDEELSARFLCIHKGVAVLSIGSPVEHIAVAPAAQPDWVSAQLHKLHLKRATDLIPPPFDKATEHRFSMHERGMEGLLNLLETTHKTAVIKVSSQEWRSRSVLLLYHGRVVGTIYTCKGLPQTQPSGQALELMLADLQLASTALSVYQLPDNIMFPLSALFMGYRVQRLEHGSAADKYVDYILDWLNRRSMTGCMPLALPGTNTTCLMFVDHGNFVGAHHVEPQVFAKDLSYIKELLSKDDRADLEATVVPEQPDDSAYGVNLRKALDAFRADQ